MKKGYIKLLIISLGLICLLVLNAIFGILNSILYIFFLLAIFCLTIYLIGFEKDDYIYKKDAMVLIGAITIIYLILTYTIGLFVGFYRNGYSLKILSILRNVIPIIFIIILEELIRYNLIKKGSRNKLILVLVVVITTTMDLTLITKGFKLSVPRELLNYLLIYLIPFLAKNICLTYMSFKVGYKGPMLYRFVMELSLYFLPIFPNLGDYINTVSKIILAVILIFSVYKFYAATGKPENHRSFPLRRMIILLLGFFTLLLVTLNSGWFKYYTFTVGSNSMSPAINKGDVIVVEKLKNNELELIEVGDILVFQDGNRVIIHRVVNVLKINNEFFYYTKGDNNETQDPYPIDGTNVIGFSKFRIPAIGTLTVWLSEVVNK